MSLLTNQSKESEDKKTFQELKESNVLKCKNLTVIELVNVMDSALYEMVKWLTGSKFSDTIYSCVYLYDVFGIEDQILSTFLIGYIKIIVTMIKLLDMDIFSENEFDCPKTFMPFIDNFTVANIAKDLKKIKKTLKEKSKTDLTWKLIYTRLDAIRGILLSISYLTPEYINTGDYMKLSYILKLITNTFKGSVNKDVNLVGYDCRRSEQFKNILFLVENYVSCSEVNYFDCFMESYWGVTHSMKYIFENCENVLPILRIVLKCWYEPFISMGEKKSKLLYFLEHLFRIENAAKGSDGVVENLLDLHILYVDKIKYFSGKFFINIFSDVSKSYLKMRSLIHEIKTYIQEEGNVLFQKNILFISHLLPSKTGNYFPYKEFLVYFKNLMIVMQIQMAYTNGYLTNSEIKSLTWVLSTKIFPELERSVRQIILFLKAVQKDANDKNLCEETISILTNEAIYFNAQTLSLFAIFIVTVKCMCMNLLRCPNDVMNEKMTFYHRFVHSVPVFSQFEFSSYNAMERESNILDNVNKNNSNSLFNLASSFASAAKACITTTDEKFRTFDMGEYEDLCEELTYCLSDIIKAKIIFADPPIVPSMTSALFFSIKCKEIEKVHNK